MKICSIVGARPQFIKAAPLSRQLRQRFQEVLIHTGQHYDDNLSRVFFQEMDIPAPDYNLEIGSFPHGKQTGLMMIGIEEILEKEKPDLVIVYGDTNSTLAGALVAVKLHCPVGHVEAGLRSYNRAMPEEINRVLADRASDFLFCPTRTAVDNLEREGITRGSYMTGDVMYDALKYYRRKSDDESLFLSEFDLTPGEYYLLTVHRAENTDNSENLRAIMETMAGLDKPVVFLVHPRTRNIMEQMGLELSGMIRPIEPVGYLQMMALESNAKKILTDSGGVQKEAYMLGVPCVTLRNETEWVETVEEGWNILVGTDRGAIKEAVQTPDPSQERKDLFGDGHASRNISRIIEDSPLSM
jgi:UDP-N-acetylglucosamine 2-epimerase